MIQSNTLSGSPCWNQGVLVPALSHHGKTITYFGSGRISGHLDLVLTVVVGVVRKWLRFRPDDLNPEKAAPCSEAPDEETLVLFRGPVSSTLLVRWKKNQCMASNASRKTDWFESSVAICNGSINLLPIKTFPIIRERLSQRNFRLPRVINKCSGTPCRGQSTSRDENEVFHALNAESYLLRPLEPADHIISDVVHEHLCADGIFVLAILRNGEKCSVALARICDPFTTERISVNPSYCIQHRTLPYSEGDRAYISPKTSRVDTLRE